LRQRIVTGVLAGIVFGIMTIIGGWFYNGIVLALAIIGFYEYARLNGFRPYEPIVLPAYIGMLAIAFPWQYAGLADPPASAVIWCLMFALLAVTVLTKNKVTLDSAALMLLGAVYIGYGFSEMIVVRSIEPNGLFLTALAFFCIWASDIGAYFVGRAIGRTKLWPAISPNKTIEGAFGGILIALLVGVCFYLAAPECISLEKVLMIGLLAAVAGQLGDLIQSAYKRLRGVKDSGRLLPGHGGVLDRCDSWLIVFPLLTLTGLLP
jgi:phosphatidate cytidylyltransferase